MTRSPRSAFSILSGHTLIYLVGSLGAKLAAFLLLPLFTPLLTRSEYGILEMTDSTIALLLQLTGFQLDAALTRAYLGTDDGDRRRRIVSTAFLAVIGLTTLAALPLALLARPLAELLLDDPSQAAPLRYAALILVAIVVAEVPLAVLKAERRSVEATGWQLVRLVVELVLKIVFVVSCGFGVAGVLAGQAIAGVAFLLGIAAWLVMRFGCAFDRGEFLAMAKYSAPMVFAGLCQFALHSSDRYLFRAFSNLDELGLYGVAYKLGYAPTGVLLGAFLLVWYPYVFSLRDPEERRRLIARASEFVPSLLVLATLPLVLLAPELVAWLTDEKFHAAWRSVPVVAFAYGFWALFQMLQTPFYVHGKTARTPRITLIAIAVNVCANIVLLPRLGGFGAALSTVLAMIVLCFVARREAERIEPIAIAWTRLLALIPPCAAAALALYPGTTTAPTSLLVRCLVLLLALLWIGVLLLRSTELQSLLAHLRRRGASP